MLSNAFSAVAKVFGFAQHRSELKNAQDVKQGAINAEGQKTQDAVTTHVANKDVQATRKDISLSLLIIGLFLSSCTTTIIPRHVEAKTVAFDGNEQNGGFIRYDASGAGVVTSGGRANYNLLIRSYGNQMLVPLQEDAGVTAGPFEDPYGPTYLIDAQHMVQFGLMADMWRNKKAPK